ncbi:glycosyltransferase family 2 protein [Dyadobacter sp. 50-39]|uniref:glycosyltransferase family 2 protein n=1 Tax=Dyadobacter sp. 50-39 TaxID=1895756 RepID=UPI0025C11F6A|nr:glycosyltransferase family 2 protein [Dyadobacter sp. 50-39]
MESISTAEMPGVSVLMPTYNQSTFILRALNSLRRQSYQNWELIIINDGCTDDTDEILRTCALDIDYRYLRNKVNMGLGYSLNRGIDEARYELVAYLPSDDIFFEDHLGSLISVLADPGVLLAFSGTLFNYSETLSSSTPLQTLGQIDGTALQLVQVMHRKVAERWIERSELVTADLEIMYWEKLSSLGRFVPSGEVTAEWVNHPRQRSKLISELYGGGISTYKQFYGVSDPITFIGSGNYIEEQAIVDELEDVQVTREGRGLKILLVGELSFNPERILAFEQAGHSLFGLWIQASGFLCSVGPFPFGNVTTLTSFDQINEIQPDIIYGLLNYSSVHLVTSVRAQFPKIPLVWHFKESPFYCRQSGSWEDLIRLYRSADGCIYLNETMKAWFDDIVGATAAPTYILDGDLPKIDWFKTERKPRLSLSEGSLHTVVVGRPYGIHPDHLAILSRDNVHVHFYGNFQQNVWRKWINEANLLAPGYLHIHDNCEPFDWVEELSQYDAGWGHVYDCSNFGELLRATWNELNIPARIPTLICAGLPVLIKDNSRHVCATESLLDKKGYAVKFNSFDQIGALLSNSVEMEKIREQIWCSRHEISFDHNVNDLLAFFEKVIDYKRHECSIDDLQLS